MTDGSALGVTPDVIKRIVCKKDWWENAPRVFDENACSVFDLSFPEGYEVGRKTMDTQFEGLLRESQQM